MENLKLTHVTLMEEVETEEAQEIYDKYNQKYRPLVLIPLILLTITLIILFISLACQSMILLSVASTFSLIAFLATIIGASAYSSRMAPYNKLLKIAKRNDEIRHEERIREKERQRLANPANRDKAYTINDIDGTLPDEK